MPRSPSLPALSALAVLFAVACSDQTESPTAPGETVEARGGGGSTSITEGFTEWDPSRWTASSHALGRGRFLPENVFVQDPGLHLRLPAETFNGGEVRSNVLRRYGVYEARMKAAAAAGSLTAFFLYQETPVNGDEIDVEVIPSLGEVWFTVWTNGVQVHHREVPLSDPTGFHVYKIDFAKSRIRFYVDGILRADLRSRLPDSDMHVMVNAWWPTWLSGGPSSIDQHAVVDWIRY